MPTPRLRVFAGPNGSGKSTIKEQVPPNLINTYVNADEIEKSAKADGFVDLTQFNVQATGDELRTFFASHALIQKEHLQDQASLFDMNGLRIDVRRLDFNSYHASVIADFIRQKLLENRVSFTFETVMSSGDKVAFMRRAQELGYRTYLYFVATDNPNININRVANRVDDGGHNVPADKIVQRYHRSLKLLPEAVAASNRAYIFDNSGEGSVWLAEITDGTSLEYKSEEQPDWFMEAYVDKVMNVAS
ncbi:zeta toxin family protein [Pseudomonas aeruginosa]|uniref:zeta toxin family protein n=1 Tax=Pseudomonas TaxID=286 RepID=UPI0002CAE0FA|nr:MULTISPECIES: zeta toxin family protein [Pseudomonas]EKB9387806.1 zeta toxin family protein [Pseudomonas aeruginosa]EKD1543957.1 zeta toxin family protein [Pseudomonas aeruginosa]EKD2845768.1 zeta toxin family protein [Pseudomonas aeruginosa]EKU4830349.1 zeta toxin family protein [Pseudomonas aeruginosa]EKV4553726.1 zeta toxin family protein [Pseudomonas aeruginosa]